jgi:hypothetical protein
MQRSGDTDDDALVILHMFSPVKFSNGDYGVSRGEGAPPKRIRGITGPDADGVELTLQRFANCYSNNNPSGSSVKIVAGVSNDVADDPISAAGAAHGRAWGDLVVRMNNWAASQSINGQVSFNGGLDAEHYFTNSSSGALDWSSGYKNRNGGWNLFFYGDAEGCPSDKNPSTVCSWARADIASLAWEQGEVTPFPQIYDEEPDSANPPTSVNAQQWQRLSEWTAGRAAGRMNFAGGLSQKAACGSGCPGIANSPKEAWRDLWEEVNCVFDSGGCSTTDDLRWTTNISYNQSTPSA